MTYLFWFKTYCCVYTAVPDESESKKNLAKALKETSLNNKEEGGASKYFSNTKSKSPHKVHTFKQGCYVFFKVGQISP